MATERRLAAWIANRSIVPDSVRAAAGYAARTGTVDLDSLRLKRLVDRRTDRMIEDAFSVAREAIAAEFDADPGVVEFVYDTKLLLPAQLTLGRAYRLARDRADGDPLGDGPWAAGPPATRWSAASFEDDPAPSAIVARSERVTRLVVQALLDGDMRDAINDDEFEDFEVRVAGRPVDRERAATVAQRALSSDLDAQFDRLPTDIEETYRKTVAYSEAHQRRDRAYRAHYRAAEAGIAAGRAAIEREYRDGTDPDRAFLAAAPDIPYLKSQYARVGVIYEAMIDLYRGAGLPISSAFERAIVLAVIGAQIWLDDLDDYPDDRADGQLTPVTAEYVLQASDADACAAVLSAVSRYLDAARREARAADSHLTGIAIEYIERRGDPTILPGWDSVDRSAATPDDRATDQREE